MRRRLMQAAVAVAVLVASSQLIRPDRTNPPTDSSRTIQAAVEWAGYPPEVQRTLLAVSCQDVSSDKMPGVYTRVRPETKLSPQDIETICAASRQAGANAADGLRQR